VIGFSIRNTHLHLGLTTGAILPPLRC
jgi:hypothetical protein